MQAFWLVLSLFSAFSSPLLWPAVSNPTICQAEWSTTSTIAAVCSPTPPLTICQARWSRIPLTARSPWSLASWPSYLNTPLEVEPPPPPYTAVRPPRPASTEASTCWAAPPSTTVTAWWCSTSPPKAKPTPTLSSGFSSETTATNFLKYGNQVLATFLSRMITNFASRYLYGNRKTSGIRIGHWNKGPGFLQNKLVEVKHIVQGLHPHILGLSEANLKRNHDKKLAELDDYVLHTSLTLNNPEVNTSRIVVYTHRSLVVKVRKDLMCDNFSSIWLEVGLPRHRKFLVCQAYREWQVLGQADRSSLAVSEQLSRWTIFLDQWERALDMGMEVHVLGDMNLNHLNWTNQNLPASNQSFKLRSLIAALFTRILPYGVSQCVAGPTRHWPGQAPSGLDHYYTNKPDKISPVTTQHCGGSDYMLIYATRYSKAVKAGPRYVRKRSYKNFDPNKFVAAVQQINWLDLYLTEDVDEAVKILSERLLHILDEAAPMKTIQVRTKYAPWLSRQTVELIKERNNLQREASKNNDKEIWKKFKVLRNKINNRLKFEERNWHKLKLEECGENSSKTWKNVKGILQWKTSGSPNQLFCNGKLISRPQELADAQNEFFLKKIDIIRENLPPSSSDPLQTLKKVMNGRTCNFSLSPVHPEEVEKVLKNLSNSSSFGLDFLDTSTIKLVQSQILPALTHIINLSISTRKFPDSWKKVKIIPLHKKDDLLNPKNYRPVAIIPILSKVLERVIFNQMIKYLNNNNLLHPNHHAYRENHNTTTALLQMYDVWLESLEKGEVAAVCFLDMSAAFDIVDHPILIKKLQLYGFDSGFLEWIASYLDNRSQCVSIDGCLSKLRLVQQGVPQGSILGPLLYIIFTNELPEVVHSHCSTEDRGEEVWPNFTMVCSTCGCIGCYADDTTYTFWV